MIPAAPGFYQKPMCVDDLVDFIVQRVLDHLCIEVKLTERWTGRVVRSRG